MTQLDQKTRGLFQDFARAFTKLRVEVSPGKVHRLRTTIRRIESFICYVDPNLGRKQTRRLDELTRLRKRAGKVRNFDVQIRLLGSIANRSTVSDRRVLVELFKARRDKQARRLSSALKKLEKSGLLVRLEKILGKSGSLANSDNNGKITPLEQAKSELLSLSADVPAHQNIKPRLLHELRISLKLIRYTAELAEESDGREQFLGNLKSVHDAIGEWHDWQSLVKTAEKKFGDRVNCPLLVEMRSLFAAKYSAANSAVANLLLPSTTVVNKKQPQSASSQSVSLKPNSAKPDSARLA